MIVSNMNIPYAPTKAFEEKLKTLPYVFYEFYNYMEAEQKSYATIKHYIEYVADFMNVVSPNKESDFYDGPISDKYNSQGVEGYNANKGNGGEAAKNTASVSTEDDESDEELQRQILMLQARLNEREQMKKCVVTAEDNYCNDLPF